MYESSNQQIVYISLDNLKSHPDNPRKELGDLSEIAESIKVNGVYQNLTVVPDAEDGKYTIIIGHRRAAAAKLAGLESVPCIVADMTAEEQLATMLAENMQRSDLTVFEQAKSFQQLSMGFGKTVAEISAMSGFSEATVRRRQRLAELDEKKFQKAVTRGGTLFDFAELEKIEDPEAKEHCLEQIGTKNFQNALRSALDAQKTKRKLAHWKEQIGSFALLIKKQGEVNGTPVEMTYFRGYGYWTTAEDVEVPSDAETVRYFYTESEREITLYREVTTASILDAAKKAREEIRAQSQARWMKAVAIAKRHRELRTDFIKTFGASKTHAQTIMRACTEAMLAESKRNYYGSLLDQKEYAKLLGIAYDNEARELDAEALRELRESQPERVLLLTAYWYKEKGGTYARQKFDFNSPDTPVEHQENPELDALYAFLEKLGYVPSDEEQQMADGSHEVYGSEEIPAGTMCLLCKAAHPQCSKCCAECTEPCNIKQECHKD